MRDRTDCEPHRLQTFTLHVLQFFYGNRRMTMLLLFSLSLDREKLNIKLHEIIKTDRES